MIGEGIVQRPSIGDLLAGLRGSLEAQVLPALPDGQARRQLKAGLHLLKRLERSWDMAMPHLMADNADIEQVLEALEPAGKSLLELRIAEVPDEAPSGYNHPALRDAALRNLKLHRILADTPDSDAVRALHLRMVARDLAAVGEEGRRVPAS